MQRGNFRRPGRWNAKSFWDRFAVNGNTGCWEWKKMQRKRTRCGWTWYGRFIVAQVSWLAHRYSWMIHHGEPPEGMEVLHKCDNGRCVNPAHLFLGTQADNVKDRDLKGRNFQSRKTHCANGHPYSRTNTYRHGASRHCKVCNRAGCKRRYDALKASGVKSGGKYL